MALEEYEGHPVEAASVAITKAGDGLSSELEVAPVALPWNSEVYYVLHGRVDHVTYDKLPKKLRAGPLVLAAEDAMVRKHTIETLVITQVDRADVVTLLDAANLRINRAREDMEGTLRLAVDPEDSEAMQLAHDGGLHPEPVDGCPACYPDSAASDEVGAKRATRKRAANRGSGG